jgi:hypothetical protein
MLHNSLIFKELGGILNAQFSWVPRFRIAFWTGSIWRNSGMPILFSSTVLDRSDSFALGSEGWDNRAV